MHFRPFSVKKITICLKLGISPPKTPDSQKIGKNLKTWLRKKSVKIGFPMPTSKNRFQILILHPKKHILKKKKTWSCQQITKIPDAHPQ